MQRLLRAKLYIDLRRLNKLRNLKLSKQVLTLKQHGLSADKQVLLIAAKYKRC